MALEFSNYGGHALGKLMVICSSVSIGKLGSLEWIYTGTIEINIVSLRIVGGYPAADG
jgi:hypothetical protein